MKLFLPPARQGRLARIGPPLMTSARLRRRASDEMHLVGAALKRMKIQPDFILSSPLPRALRTAEIAGEALAVSSRAAHRARAGFQPRGNATRSSRRLAGCDVMLVGHEPDFSRLIRSLTGGRVKLPKAAIAAVEIGDECPPPASSGSFPPKMLIRLYQQPDSGQPSSSPGT